MWWWKAAAILILVYALVAGLLVPLKPNLLSVTPAAAVPGQRTQLEVLGYNTRFDEDGEHLRAWLFLDEDHALPATELRALTPRRATLTFRVPATLPEGESTGERLSLIVSGPATGTFVDPEAVVIRRGEAAVSSAGWTEGALRAGDLVANEAVTFPFRKLLGETIRNTYFHVSLWFAMLFLFITGFVYAIRYLVRKRKGESTALDRPLDLAAITKLERLDHFSVAFTGVGMLFGTLGLLTGAVWAKYTWGSFWNWDIKQFTTLIALLIYAGYFVLRAAFAEGEQRARLGAVYNIFAFACLIPLIYILPRLSATSLHPGAEGNPALGGEDLDNTMRMVFYPTIIGWTLIGGWMAGLAYRAKLIFERLDRRDDQFANVA
jgi:heme exporter protein C